MPKKTTQCVWETSNTAQYNQLKAESKQAEKDFQKYV